VLIDPLFWISATAFLAWLVFALVAGRGAASIARLEDQTPCPPDECPNVSIVVAARDEEHAIEDALKTLLAQDLPRLEIVAVNDRSADRTGALLDALAQGDARLTVVHVTELPPRWLGKNHALHLGAARARGELILFTDADVHFAPDAVRRALTYLHEHALDHLTVLPDVVMKGPLLQAFTATFSILFAGFTRPWKARDPSSAAHLGIGAFNLVRAQAYRARGGHLAIALRPDDDLRLGRLMKSEGGRQDVLFGQGALSVEWYRTVGEVVRGFEKNAFAGYDYRLWLQVLATPLQLLFGVWPFVGVFVTEGPARWMSLAAVVIALAAVAGTRRSSSVNPLVAPLFPVVVLVFVYIQWRATLLTLWRGGITWRGTFYPLSELRA